MARKGIIYKPFRIQDQQSDSDDDEDPPQSPPHRRSTSNRPLVRMNSRDDGGRQQKDAGGGRRLWKRSSSTPPDDRNSDRRPQDGRMGLGPVWADDSRASVEKRDRRTPGAAVPARQAQAEESGQRSGQLQDPRRRRRSSDAKRSGSAPDFPWDTTAPPPKPPPAIFGEMKLRNLLRRNSRSRPKILFYNKHEPYYGFTNFSPHPVMYQGKQYPTSEHLFQSLKVSRMLSSARAS